MNRQVKSQCCDAELKVFQADEGTCCFICTKCGKPSDMKVEVPMDAKLQTLGGVPKEETVKFKSIHIPCPYGNNDCTVCGREGGHILPIKDTKAEIISLIYSMVLNKEVDDVEASKIVNKIRSEENKM